eukprot:1543532-Heterocapsa_arctica.AAC.1
MLSTEEDPSSGPLPNDPNFDQQWALGRDPGATNWADVFQSGRLPGEPKQGKVVVAVLDTGVDLTHPDLVGSLWTNKKEEGGVAGEDDDRNGYMDDVRGWDFTGKAQDDNVMDLVGSGTQMAGVIAAQLNNS